MDSFVDFMVEKGVLILGVLAVVGVVVLGIAYAGSSQTQTCTVTEKDRTTKVVDGTSETDIRIWTEECGVLSMNDSLVGMSFDTADKYGQVKVGQTYEFKTFGWRIPVFSSFPNITEVRPVQG